MNRLHVTPGGRYPVLRALAILQLVAAGLVAVAGIIGAVYAANWAGNAASFGDKMIIVLGGLSVTFFLVVFTLAAAELIKLLIDIEHNTRMASAASNSNGHAPAAVTGTSNRMRNLEEEESAEAALIRGH